MGSAFRLHSQEEHASKIVTLMSLSPHKKMLRKLENKTTMTSKFYREQLWFMALDFGRWGDHEWPGLLYDIIHMYETVPNLGPASVILYICDVDVYLISIKVEIG